MTEVLDRLSSAENERDWDAFRSLLHPQVEWTLIGPKTTVIRGRDAYMRRIEDAYTSAPGSPVCGSPIAAQRGRPDSHRVARQRGQRLR